MTPETFRDEVESYRQYKLLLQEIETLKAGLIALKEPLTFDSEGNATLRLTAEQLEVVKEAVRDFTYLGKTRVSDTEKELAAILFDEGELNQ
jgi:hypothetical protein